MEDILFHAPGILAVCLIFGLPIVAVVMAFVSKMRRDKQQNEIRKLVIENNVDPETAKLLVEEPKKRRTKAEMDFGTLRKACLMLGIGLGTLIDKLACIDTKSIYFWLVIAFGVGIGLLTAFLVEMHFAAKKLPQKGSDEVELPEQKE